MVRVTYLHCKGLGHYTTYLKQLDYISNFTKTVSGGQGGGSPGNFIRWELYQFGKQAQGFVRVVG